MLVEAVKEENENLLYQQYLVDYGHMDESTFMNFESYKAKAFGIKPPKVDVEEILDDVKEIIKSDSKRLNIDGTP